MNPKRRSPHRIDRANLSFEQLEKYLKLLLGRGLLTEESTESGVYSSTDVGRHYLRELVHMRVQGTFCMRRRSCS